jgi:phospholipase/carboxylesterase
MALATVEIQPDGPAQAVLIWLHGLGADGHDFVPVAEQLRLPLPVRFVFPHAPVRPVTINGGVRMRAWYDLLALGPGGVEDRAGLTASAEAVGDLIDAQRLRGAPAARIFLAGFSQGGALALHAGLRRTEPLAGILVLSAYLPLADAVPAERARAAANTPIWMGHGVDDPVIPLGLAERSRELLTSLGYDLEWHRYPIGHSVSAEEIGDINDWLVRRLR